VAADTMAAEYMWHL